MQTWLLCIIVAPHISLIIWLLTWGLCVGLCYYWSIFVPCLAFRIHVAGDLNQKLSFVASVLSTSFQSRRHGGLLWAWPPQTKLQAPPKWNMKHYKSVEFSSIFRVSSSLAQTQCPHAETQSPPIENFLSTVLLRSVALYLGSSVRARAALCN